MRYFGEPYPSRDNPAPVYEDISAVPTPVGRQCLGCSKPIEKGDRGFTLPYHRDVTTEEPWHRECLLENILGPLWQEWTEGREGAGTEKG